MSPLCRNEPIAIVGTGCRFPGGCNTASKLWDLLKNPKDLCQDIPSERFNVDRFYHEAGNHHGTTNVRSSYLLAEDVALFDHKFFAIPPGEAEAIDPQQRLMLEVTYDAIESAGLTIDALAGSDTAVYVGIMTADYLMQQSQNTDFLPKYNATGVAGSNASSRLSYFFNWHGPSMTIDTACSSSLVAVNEAVQALRTGVSRVAVVGGTNLLLYPFSYISESNLNMLSPSGRCRMWDSEADGYGRGEGVAAVVLKTLSAAIEDGDQIECVIREIGLNHDGRTTGLTMPSAAAQADLIRKVYRQAGLDPLNKNDRCQFFEAHGTGTPVGDPQEAEALSMAFFDGDTHGDIGNNTLYVGSIKTVIGHTEGTAGLAGLLKACLAMKHGIIPPNLLFNHLNPRLEPFASHLRIPTVAQAWPVLPSGIPRRVSVNSFGFGGANAHCVLESLPSTAKQSLDASCVDTSLSNGVKLVKGADLPTPTGKSPQIPFVFSAATTSSLSAMLRSFAEYLGRNAEVDPVTLADVLARRKSAHPVKIAFAAPSIRELHRKISEELARSDEKGNGPLGNFTPGKAVILGVFNGQGPQWATMGVNLLLTVPFAQSLMQELDDALSTLSEASRPRWSLTRELLATSTSRIDQAEISQPLCTAVQIVLVELLKAAGVEFTAVIGHSSGEITAAFAAGFLSKADAIRISYYRGYYARLASGNGTTGGMLAAGTSFEDARDLCELEDFAGQLHVAANNSPHSVTLSGDLDAIERAKFVLEEEKKFARQLRVDTAYHSHHMVPCAAPYLAAMQECDINILEPPEDAPQWFSSVNPGSSVVATSTLSAQYWVDNMTQPVLFFNAVEDCWRHFNGNFTFALEIGPHPALKSPMLESLQYLNAAELPYSGTLSRGKNDVEAFKEALGSLWTHAGTGAVSLASYAMACSATCGSGTKRVPELPPYPWHHDRRLLNEPRSYRFHRSHDIPYHELLGRVTDNSSPDHWQWRNVLHVHEISWLEGHALQGQPVFPATGYVALAMEAAMQIGGRGIAVELVELRELEIIKAIALSEVSGTELSVHMSHISVLDLGTRQETTAEFTVYSALASSDSVSLALNCRGSVRLVLGKSGDATTLPPRDLQEVNMSTVDVTRFYSALRNDAGYTYDALFKSITSLSRRYGFSSGTIETPTYVPSSPLLFHPAVADCALQGMFATSSAPGDGSITSIRVPKRCRRIVLVPSLCGAHMTDTVHFDCTLDRSSGDTMMAGDIDVFSAGYNAKILQFEGLEFVPLAPLTGQDDKCVYQESIWCADQPDGNLVMGDRTPTPMQKQKALDAERAAFFYLKQLHTSVHKTMRGKLPWYRQALLESAEQVVERVQRKEHEYANGWIDDTHERIVELMDSYGDDPDFDLTRAVGEHLPEPAVLSGEVNILEYMTENDYLGRYYREAAGFESLNESVAGLVAQLSNKHPHMHFCEIGAGTGGATKPVLDAIGTSYASYTYTDISSGFFESAQEKFRTHSQKMIFKTLNIEHDPVSQGFEPNNYDCIIAANVLHATKSMDATMRNVRRLLKPGGYLVLFEIIGNKVMRIGTVMGGLPGWWVGRDDGRRWAPTLELDEWDAILKRTGFSGIDTHTPMIDPISLPGSIFCSMACDDRIRTLRDPLANVGTIVPFDNLVLIRGRSAAGHDLTSVLEPFFRNIITAESLDFVPDIPKGSHVVCLEDCAGATFQDITEERWANLKRLLDAPKTVLWVTAGAHNANPYAGMSIGLFRNLYYELIGTLVQVLDCEDDKRVDVRRIAELQLRLAMSARMQDEGDLTEILWTIEPELRLRNGSLEVPRVRPHESQNSRVNSSQRSIFRLVDARTNTLELKTSNGLYQILERHEEVAHVLMDHEAIRVSTSLLVPIQTPAGYAFVHLGVSEQSGRKMLFLSGSLRSRVVLHKTWGVAVDPDVIDQQYMSLVVGDFVNQQLISLIPATGAFLAHECDPGLASLLSKRFSVEGRKVVFTSVKPETTLRTGNWTWLHPQSTSRAISSIIPDNVSAYLDASDSSAASNGVATRIDAIVPKDCRRIRMADLLGDAASRLPREAPSTIAMFLQHASCFASAQLNGIPEGAPMDTMQPRHIVTASPSSVTAPILVDWLGANQVPVLEEPIGSWPGLFRCDRSYWLAGLSGDLGRSMADFMIAHGARYVALSSRNPVADKQWVEWHHSHGKHVSFYQCDITDLASVEQARLQITSTMPAIGGVALGALVLCDRMFAQMTLDEFQLVARPKVDGALNLDHVLDNDDSAPLDFFIGFSSVVATMGNPGQANYAAANCFMKAIVNQRRARGRSGSIIDISRVVGVGFVEREMKADGRLTREQKERLFTGSMTLAMSEADLHQVFAEAIVAGTPGSTANSEIITGIAPVRRDEAHPNSWSSNPKFGLLVRVGEEGIADTNVPTGQIPVKRLLEEAQSDEERSKTLNDCLRSKIRVVLFLSTSDIISDTVPLIDMGVDSLVGVDLRAWCLKELAVDIPVMKILGGASLNDLTAEILSSLASDHTVGAAS